MNGWTIRAAEGADLPGVSDLLGRCGWHDPNRVRTLSYIADSPDGRITVAESATGLVGVAGALHFRGTGWVTTMAVDPSARHAGLGARLSEVSIGWMHERGARTTFCLITPAVRRLCQTWEFVEEEEVALGWLPAREAGGEGPAPHGATQAEARPVRPEDLEQIWALDREATGEDRSAFLRAAVAHSGVAVEGQDGELLGFDLYCRWGPGPTVARTPEVGLALIETRRRTWRGPRAILLPVANQSAQAGLPEAKWFMRLTRMRRGPAVPRRPDMQFGICNFYWG